MWFLNLIVNVVSKSHSNVFSKCPWHCALENARLLVFALNKLGSLSNEIYNDLECLGPLVAASLALGRLQRAGPRHSKSRRFHRLAV